MPLSLEEIWTIIRPYLPAGGSMANIVGGPMQKKLPQKAYWDWIQRAIDVHAQGKPLDKIRQLRPNEPNKNLDWRELAGEPVTMGYWWRAISEIGGVLTNSTAQLLTTDETLKYIDSSAFGGSSLYSKFTSNYIDKIINQPNGLTVAYPCHYVDFHGVEPLQHYAHDSIYYIDKEIVVWLSDESEIEEKVNFKSFNEKKDHDDPYQKRDVKSSYTPVVTKTIKKAVFNASTKDFFIRIEHNDAIQDFDIDFWSINLNHNPAFQNGGLGKDVTCMEHVYYSFFHPAIPYGNLGLNGLSDFLSVRAKAAYPHVWMISEKCPGEGPETSCYSGYIKEPNLETGDITTRPCNTCAPHGGKGKIIVLSPEKIHLKSLPDNDEHPNTDKTPIGFIQANPENVKLTGIFVDADLIKYVEALCLFTKKGEGAESGQSIGLQMETTLSLMRRIGPVIFGNLEKAIAAFQGYISGTPEGAKVIQPIRYGIASETVTLHRVFESFKEDMPAILRQTSVRQYLDSYVGGNSPVLKAVEIMEMIDPFFYYSFKQKGELMGNGGMTKEQYNLSTQGFPAATQAIKKNPEYSAIELIEMVKSLIISTAPAPQDDTLPDVSPEQLEAQARLRGSVGGVQGIQTGVAAGTTDYEAAISTLMEIYGFNREIAVKVLGTPNTNPNPAPNPNRNASTD